MWQSNRTWIHDLLVCSFVCVSIVFSVLPLFGQSDSDIHAKGGQTRWLLVTTPELARELEPLVRRRQEQGFEVHKVVRGEQIQSDDWNSESIRKSISELSRQNQRSTYVLLVGSWDEQAEKTYLPAAVGKQGRMADAPTDHAYGLPNENGVPTIAVGRFPARSVDDVRHFVARVIRYEDQTIGPWTNRLNLWVGHPGGHTTIEKRLGEAIVQSAVNKSLGQLDLSWQGNCLIDFPDTPFSVDRQVFRERMLSDLAQGQCFTIYAGHSNAEGIWSEDQFVFTRDEWAKVKIQSSPGVVLTTGCFACQTAGWNGQGFLVSSMYNPDGPVACIGAFGVSYAAHGQLALDAFVELVARPRPPDYLGDYWLAIAAGIGGGKMDSLTFWLYDQADGSRGAVALDRQRLEHLEMWTLLGDPALRIPFLEPKLAVDIKAEIGSTEVAVEFDVPEELFGAECEVQVHFRPASRRKAKPAPIITTQQLDLKPRFASTITGLEPLAEGELHVRVFASKDGSGKLGVAAKSLDRPDPSRPAGN